MKGDVMMQATWGDPLAAQLGGGDARIRGSDPASHLRHMARGPGAIMASGSSQRVNTARGVAGVADTTVEPSQPVTAASGDAKAQVDTPWWLDIWRAPFLNPETGEVENPARQGAQEGVEGALGAPVEQVGTRLLWGGLGAALVLGGILMFALPAVTGGAKQ